jgi:dienelactone hydrolase
MVFLLSGNAYASAWPSSQTRTAALDLATRGDQPVQLSYPAMNRPSALGRLVTQIQRISMGQPIGLIGFSAGGTIALRLAGAPGLNVKAVLSFYGPPDLADWLNQHVGDAAYRRVTQNLGQNQAFIRSMSGPLETKAQVFTAFGLKDQTVVALPSTQSLLRDFPTGQVYYYPGPHGVSVFAKCGAYPAFLESLS